MKTYRRIGLAVFLDCTLGGFAEEPPSVDDAIMRMRTQNLSLRTIGQRVGLGHVTIYERLKKQEAA